MTFVVCISYMGDMTEIEKDTHKEAIACRNRFKEEFGNTISTKIYERTDDDEEEGE